MIPLLLNLETGAINTAYHVVLDNWFATVPTKEGERPDFTSDMAQIVYLHEKDANKLIDNLRNHGFALTKEGDLTSFLGIKFEKDEETGSRHATAIMTIIRYLVRTTDKGTIVTPSNWQAGLQVVGGRGLHGAIQQRAGF